MDKFAFSSDAPLWGLVLVLAVVAIVLLRFVRSRHDKASTPAPDRSPAPADTDFLDSSHVGGPIFDGTTGEHPDRGVDIPAHRGSSGTEPTSGRG